MDFRSNHWKNVSILMNIWTVMDLDIIIVLKMHKLKKKLVFFMIKVF